MSSKEHCWKKIKVNSANWEILNYTVRGSLQIRWGIIISPVCIECNSGMASRMRMKSGEDEGEKGWKLLNHLDAARTHHLSCETRADAGPSPAEQSLLGSKASLCSTAQRSQQKGLPPAPFNFSVALFHAQKHFLPSLLWLLPDSLLPAGNVEGALCILKRRLDPEAVITCLLAPLKRKPTAEISLYKPKEGRGSCTGRGCRSSQEDKVGALFVQTYRGLATRETCALTLYSARHDEVI